MVKFGILGCGTIANIHADAVSKIKDATLLGVADNNYEFAQRFAEKNGVKAYASYNEMLIDKEIDVICVCTPSCFHAENAIDALKSGKHVVLEKPMALNVDDADKLICACEKYGKLLTVICQLRFSKDVEKVKKLVEENAFGKITLCDLTMKYYRSKEYYSSSPWKGKLKFDGGGALMNQGIHGIDLLQYIVGDIKDVSGKIATLSHDVEVEDTAVATVTFKSGALGVIQASTCAYPGFDRQISIHGEKGCVVLIEDKISKLFIDGKEEVNLTIEKSLSASDATALKSDMHQKQIENLINAIDGKEDLLIDAKEGKKAVKIITDIYKKA